MWATIGGNTEECFSGSAIVPPALTDSMTEAIERSITALPAVLPQISSACMTGTPAEVNDEKVRDQRAMQTIWTTSPIFIAMRSLKASHCGRPRELFFDLMKAAAEPTTPPIRRYHWWRTTGESPTMN